MKDPPGRLSGISPNKVKKTVAEGKRKEVPDQEV
jgi:hypothetical protein